MVFGCYYPYMSMFYGYPSFYGGGWCDNSPWGYSRASYMNGMRNAAMAATTFPYGFSTNIGGIQTYGMINPKLSPEEAYDVNRMINDPSYIPNPRIKVTPYDQTREGKLDAEIKSTSNKISLDIEYRSLTKNLSDYLSQLDAFVAQTPNLTEEHKQKLEAKKQEALALQKRLQEFAKNSADKDVSEALNTVVGMRNEYYKLRDESIALNKQIMSELSNAGNAGNAGGTDGASDAGNADGADNAGGAGEGNPIDNMSGQELLENYEDEIKPKIEELKQSDKLTEADKKAIDDKQKELEKAIADEKTEDEIRSIEKELENLVKGGETKAKYETDVKPAIEELKNNSKLDEETKKDIEKKQKALENAITKNRDLGRVAELAEALEAAVEAAQAKVKEDATTKEDENYVKQVEASKKAIETARQDIKNVEMYIPYSSRQDLANLIDLLNKAIEENKPAEEINKLRAQVESMALNLKNAAITKQKNADKIAGKIYQNSVGVDDEWAIFSMSEKEKAIYDAVKEINKNNVVDVLVRWEHAYKKNFRDSNMIETIFGEFMTDDETKAELSQHISKALEDYAKEHKIHDKIAPHIRTIQGSSVANIIGRIRIYQAYTEIINIIKKAEHIEIPESLESTTSSSGGVS